ncbi:MAG: glycosyltransferase [Bacteroides sp.]|nr:glycosyltransferase [Bacteroides sp.]
MTRFLIVIVAYKTTISKLVPLRYFSTLRDQDFHILIYDNSPTSTDKDVNLQNISYIHDPNNSGISTAYNVGAKYAQINGYDWMILFDQDTLIANDFLNITKISIKKNPLISLFVPTVKFQRGGIMSPKVCRFYRPSHSSIPEGVNNLRNVSIINSGICIRTTIFIEAGGYNEKTAVDFADYQFIERLEKVITNFYVTEAVLIQDFSNNEISEERLYSRFVIYCQSIKNYETSYYRKIALYYTGFLHSVALCRRTKSKRFITHFFKSLF